MPPGPGGGGGSPIGGGGRPQGGTPIPGPGGPNGPGGGGGTPPGGGPGGNPPGGGPGGTPPGGGSGSGDPAGGGSGSGDGTGDPAGGGGKTPEGGKHCTVWARLTEMRWDGPWPRDHATFELDVKMRGGWKTDDTRLAEGDVPKGQAFKLLQGAPVQLGPFGPVACGEPIDIGLDLTATCLDEVDPPAGPAAGPLNPSNRVHRYLTHHIASCEDGGGSTEQFVITCPPGPLDQPGDEFWRLTVTIVFVPECAEDDAPAAGGAR